MHMNFDVHWHKQALAGQPAALDALVAGHGDDLFRYCYYRLAQDRHAAEEAVQETLLTAFDRLKHYDPRRSDGAILPWLRGLALNAIRKISRRSKHLRSLDGIWAGIDRDLKQAFDRLEEQAMPADQLLREETSDLVGAAMSQLPDRYRLALEAKYVDGESTRHIAQTLTISETAADSLLKRARAALRQALSILGRHLDGELL